MTDYYDHTSYPATGGAGSSSAMRAELELIEAGFAKLLPYTANANKIPKINAGGTAQTASILSDDGTTATVAGGLTVTGITTLTNTGLHVLDTDASHDLILKPGSNLTADKTLTITTGDADRTLDISAGSVTVSAFGATLTDDIDAATARGTLGVTATGSDTTYNYRANNLSDVANASTARTNLGVTATGSDTTYNYRANNLSDVANAATARTNLGVAIGTNVQAYDAGLQSISGLTTAADKMIYTTASDTYAVTDLTSTARSLLDDASPSAMLATLGAQASITGGATSITSSNLTASRALASDVSGKVAVSATTSTELGYVSGVTSAIQTQLDGKQATISGGATSITSSNLTVSRALVSDASGKVAAATTTSTEIGYVNGVTSAIQTQLNNKQPLDTQLTDIAALAVTDGNFIVGNGTTFVAESGATARASLGLVIGTDVQAYDAQLADVAGLAVTDGNFIVGNGSNFVAESGATARASLGLGSIATQASSSVSITGGSITGITDLTVADGGTGASSAASARTNLDVPGLSTANTFAGAQRGTVTALTSSAASIAINLATNNHFSHTTTENTTLAAPSNPTAGQSGAIVITQGATPRTLAYNSFWKFSNGTKPVLTNVASAVDVLFYYVESATRATCVMHRDVK